MAAWCKAVAFELLLLLPLLLLLLLLFIPVLDDDPDDVVAAVAIIDDEWCGECVWYGEYCERWCDVDDVDDIDGDVEFGSTRL